MSYSVVAIARDIVHGMAYLHSRGIIHRDLKPSNIMLTSDLKAKVGEFGMCVINEGQKLTAETGTYRYMSPEIIRHQPYDFPTDVYSFGICLWQLTTRDIPFAMCTPLEAAYSVAEGQRPAIPETVHDDIKKLILACWADNPSFRPTFTELAEIMEKPKGLVYHIPPLPDWLPPMDNFNAAAESALETVFVAREYLDYDNTQTGDDGIGLEI